MKIKKGIQVKILVGKNQQATLYELRVYIEKK